MRSFKQQRRDVKCFFSLVTYMQAGKITNDINVQIRLNLYLKGSFQKKNFTVKVVQTTNYLQDLRMSLQTSQITRIQT